MREEAAGSPPLRDKDTKVERRSKRRLDAAGTEYLRPSQRYEKSRNGRCAACGSNGCFLSCPRNILCVSGRLSASAQPGFGSVRPAIGEDLFAFGGCSAALPPVCDPCSPERCRAVRPQRPTTSASRRISRSACATLLPRMGTPASTVASGQSRRMSASVRPMRLPSCVMKGAMVLPAKS